MWGEGSPLRRTPLRRTPLSGLKRRPQRPLKMIFKKNWQSEK